MIQQIRPAIVMILVMTLITGLLYPLAVTGIAQVVFPHQANGSLRVRDGKVIGSDLMGQQFTGDWYFHPRPSAAGENGYDAMASGGSNLGPTNRVLIERIQQAVIELRTSGTAGPIPVDLVTTSASGLDPDITPAAAEFQVARVARARRLSHEQVRALVEANTQERQLGLLGERRVNVLSLNLALDEHEGHLAR